MKRLVVATLAVLAIPAGALAQGSHYVRGYTRSDGTYVAPHYQTNPNNTRLDNYSTRGNVNPYTGEEGTRSPYPSYTAPSYPTYTPPSYTPPSYTSPTYAQPNYGSSYGATPKTCTAYGCY